MQQKRREAEGPSLVWHCQLSRRPSVLAARSQPEEGHSASRQADGSCAVWGCAEAISRCQCCRHCDRIASRYLSSQEKNKGYPETGALARTGRGRGQAQRRCGGPTRERAGDWGSEVDGFWIMGAWERNMGAHFFYVGTGKRATGVRGAKAMANTSTHRALFPSTLPAMCFKSKRASGGGREW